ncbi:MAG: exo-beta-N-acetylmuramidase NamZ domain-containing protein, partial [Myxococcota bacterium]
MKTGLDRILAEPSALRGRVGLIANPTTVDATLVHAADRFAAHPDIDLRLLFGPEHGIRSDAQYMEGVGDEKDDATGLPVVSLYGDTFESLSPKAEHLEQLDTLVFDIQDIG